MFKDFITKLLITIQKIWKHVAFSYEKRQQSILNYVIQWSRDKYVRFHTRWFQCRFFWMPSPSLTSGAAKISWMWEIYGLHHGLLLKL